MTGWVVIGLALKVTIVLAAGLAAVRALRRRSAALRHAVLVATTVAAAALPALDVVLPGWDLPLFGWESQASAPAASMVPASEWGAPPALETPPAVAESPADHDAGTGIANPGPAAGNVMALPPAGGEQSPWLALLLAVWATGAALVLARFALDAARTRVLLAESIDAPDGPLARQGSAIALRLGVRRPIRVLLSDRLTVPVTWGVARPVVLLPLEAWEWGPERVRIVLLHELAHVRRLDTLSSGIAELASALWWFHPLLWVCRRRLRVEQERACDDIVLLEGVGPTAYASLLVDFARALSPLEESSTARAAIAMARRSTLRDRVETILATGSRSFRLDRRAAGLMAVAALALLLPVAAVHVWGETSEARRTAELIADLESADPAAREAAAWGLGALGSETAVDPLMAHLADPDPRVRGVAARALGRIGGPAALGPVRGLLADPDPYVRELAILGLEEIPSDDVVPAIAPLLKDPEMGVRSVAVAALGDLEGEAAVRALAEAAEHDPDRHTRGMAIGGLAKRAGDATAGLPALVRLLDDPDLEIRESAAWALGEIGDPRAVPALVAGFEREASGDVRSEIVDALSRHAGDPRAVVGLLAAVGDPEWGVRHSAVAALAESDDPRAPAALVSALRDPVHQVRLEAAWSLDAIEARR